MKTQIGLIFLLTALVITASGCVSESAIKSEIENANYCSADSDCTIALFGCPFGCGSYVNKNADINHIKFLVAAYKSTNFGCMYDCMSPPFPVCSNSKCVARVCELNKEYKEFDSMEDGTAFRACNCPANSMPKKANGKLACVQSQP